MSTLGSFTTLASPRSCAIWVGTNGHGAIALPLASFNAGAEIGQMAVAVLLVPVFCWLGARPTSRVRFAAAWSVMVIAAGSYWLVERIV